MMTVMTMRTPSSLILQLLKQNKEEAEEEKSSLQSLVLTLLLCRPLILTPKPRMLMKMTAATQRRWQ